MIVPSGFYFMEVTERWNREVNAIEGRLSYLHFAREGHSQLMQDQMGKHQVWLRGRKEQEKAQARAFIKASLWKTRQDMVNSLGLASLSNSGRLWGKGTVPNCLVPDPGLT